MTRLLSIDPGGNTGIALGEYSDTEGYRLLQRWQVHGGTAGFKRWWRNERPEYDVLVIEKFILAANEFTADLTPVLIEGILDVLLEGERIQPVWQPRQAKGNLIGYPPSVKTKTQRQRFRFDFLDRFGLFAAGTDNDDSNDAITHALVFLRSKSVQHIPTMLHYWPPRSEARG